MLAYLCEQRPDFLHAHFAEVAGALAEAQPAALSAAKRNRLRCLKAAVLALAAPDGPVLAAGEDEASREEATKQVGTLCFVPALCACTSLTPVAALHK